MNKKLGLAVAGALVAFASTANAGISIPAGDWTVDIGGNVNAFYSHTKTDGLEGKNTIGTGLLPAEIAFTAKTRQNDLDITAVVSFWTSTSADSENGANAAGLNRGAQINVRQSYMTFGDASWGTVTLGRNLGLFGSDAILSDMTLLSVGGNYAPGGSTTLGRIGQGYIYADWLGQIAYSTPNWNGFQLSGSVNQEITKTTTNTGDMMWQGKATYDFAANDVTGRVWVGGTTQKQLTYTSEGVEVGAKVAYQGLGLVGYYYDGEGLSSVRTSGTGATAAYTNSVLLGVLNGSMSTTPSKTQDSGGYVQATFVVPGIGTKLGASWGESNSSVGSVKASTETWIVAAYHPLTKSLNLVAEYANADNKYTGAADSTTKTTSLGAILFF